MSKRKKEKLFEEVQFQDIERAKRTVTFAKINHIRVLIGLVFATVATILTAIGLWGKVEEKEVYFILAMFLAIPAYLIGGGIGKALKAAWKITKIGWCLIPVFPADVLLSVAFFFFSIFGFFFVPVIFVGMNYLQHRKALEAATSYLAQCGYSVENLENQE